MKKEVGSGQWWAGSPHNAGDFCLLLAREAIQGQTGDGIIIRMTAFPFFIFNFAFCIPSTNNRQPTIQYSTFFTPLSTWMKYKCLFSK
jgi:hypothetical protein